jgi:TonB-dependent receptor
VRLVGGVRFEQWALDVSPGDSTLTGLFQPTRRDETDLLWSANVKVALSESMNLRLAGYRTISRPDPREIASGEWGGVTGKCSTAGNPRLNQARILNGDIRWEWYPAPGELVSVSGYYKYFTDPFVEVVSYASLACIVTPYNARNANNIGGEFELRKGLGFVSPRLTNVSLGANFTYVDGSADLVAQNGIIQPGLPLQDQSKYLANGSLFYQNVDRGLSASVLYNYFSDRVTLYGVFSAGAGKAPDIIERGRGTLDFKMAKRFGRVSASLSGKNITNESVQESQLTDEFGSVLSGRSRPGVSFSLSLGYAF